MACAVCIHGYESHVLCLVSASRVSTAMARVAGYAADCGPRFYWDPALRAESRCGDLFPATAAADWMSRIAVATPTASLLSGAAQASARSDPTAPDRLLRGGDQHGATQCPRFSSSCTMWSGRFPASVSATRSHSRSGSSVRVLPRPLVPPSARAWPSVLAEIFVLLQFPHPER